MKTFLAAAAIAAVSCACAHQPPQPALLDDIHKLQAELESPKSATLPHLSRSLDRACLGRALHSVVRSNDPAKPLGRDSAFQNYYEAFLFSKEETQYVECLREQYRWPWLHADYRHARRWLKDSQAEMAQNSPLAGADQRIADVKEAFEPQGPDRTMRRLTITFAAGGQKVVEESFSNTP